ncbi:MAG: hypothetical protein KAJ55_12020 [Anaerolineales bacterium]|nr:hypothetical protein [Anaerolineales bacterium]
MFKRLLGGPKTGTAKINSVVGQFEGMITQLETGSQMNNDKIGNNQVEIEMLETENSSLSDVNVKAKNVKDALNAIVNGT